LLVFHLHHLVILWSWLLIRVLSALP
jgi:hypothetical protein